MKYSSWPFASERKKNTQHAINFLSVDECFRECFDQWQSVIRFPAVARCCEVSASVPDISGFQNQLPPLRRVSSPTRFPLGVLLFILYFSALLADLHGQGCHSARLSKQPSNAAVPEVWIQD